MSQISPLTLDGHKIPLPWVSRPKGILAFPQAGILDCQSVLERPARAGGFLRHTPLFISSLSESQGLFSLTPHYCLSPTCLLN